MMQSGICGRAAMAPLIGSKLKDKHTSAWLGALASLLYPGEEVTTLTKTNLMRPLMDGLAVTTARVLGFLSNDLTREGKVRIEVSAADIAQVALRSKRLSTDSLIVTMRAGQEVSFGTIQSADTDLVLGAAQQLIASGVPAEISRAIAAQAATVSQAVSAWEQIQVVGKNPSDKAWKTLKDHATPGETPRFMISNGYAGLFAAFSDRCMIVKVGAMTGIMAGSIGGGRITSFHYSEITGIEYNSGMLSGVLEVLTPSYQGTANKDYWRGTNKSRNADSNDPWTLSNTLPLDKLLYQQALPWLNEMRAWIAEAKRPTVVVSAPAPSTSTGGGLAEELGKLVSFRGKYSVNLFVATVRLGR